MKIISSILTSVTFAIAATSLTYGASLSLSTSGSFAAADVPDALVTRGANWQVSFNVDTPLSVSNPGSDGFDIGFSNFSYLVDGSLVAATPISIRFYQAANNGLFTVFFGPESGVDASGNFIPEFSFSGAALFTGSTSDPSLTVGAYPVSESLYTDANNYDDQLNTGMVNAVASTATPEPASVALLLLGGFTAAVALAKQKIIS